MGEDTFKESSGYGETPEDSFRSCPQDDRGRSTGAVGKVEGEQEDRLRGHIPGSKPKGAGHTSFRACAASLAVQNTLGPPQSGGDLYRSIWGLNDKRWHQIVPAGCQKNPQTPLELNSAYGALAISPI